MLPGDILRSVARRTGCPSGPCGRRRALNDPRFAAVCTAVAKLGLLRLACRGASLSCAVDTNLPGCAWRREPS